MNVGNIGRRLGETICDFRSLALELVHPCLHKRLVQALLDRRHDAGNRALDLLERPAVRLGLHSPITVEAVHLLRVGPYGLRDSFR